MDMKLVYICSPLRGDVERNIRKANGYCLFAATKSAVPIAPHVMFTGFLDDNILEEREMGLAMGLELLKCCSELWAFGSRVSAGMLAEIEAAKRLNIQIRHFTDKCEEVVIGE